MVFLLIFMYFLTYKLYANYITYTKNPIFIVKGEVSYVGWFKNKTTNYCNVLYVSICLPTAGQ